MMDLYEKALKKIEDSKQYKKPKKEAAPETKRIITVRNKNMKRKIAVYKEVCHNCDKRLFISQDKEMTKNGIVLWLKKFIEHNKNKITLDFLRSQKLIFESIVEMRKISRTH